MTSAARISQNPESSDTPEESTVVATRVISPKGARVRETAVVLSDAAAKRLMIQGEIPPR